MVKIDEDDAVWCLVMFDLPVKTIEQRRDATAFRNHLKDLGLSMVQLSVYCQYMPRFHMVKRTVAEIIRVLPDQGQVRIVYITDKQWSKALRFSNTVSIGQEEAPAQLTIFES